MRNTGGTPFGLLASAAKNYVSIFSFFFFSRTHSHTISQRCQSWGAACGILYRYSRRLGVRRIVLLLTLFFFSLSFFELVEISEGASHGSRGTSGKTTMARMGVLPAHSSVPTQPALICLAAHARFLYPDNHGALSFNREKEMRFKCQR